MSAADVAFAASEASIDAIFGDAGFLRGTEPVTVVLTRGVEIAGDYGSVARVVDTASFRLGVSAQRGDTLSVGTHQWILDQPLPDDTGRAEFILRAVSP